MVIQPVPDAVLAETLAANAELERRLAAIPRVQDQPPELTRRQRRNGEGIFPAPEFLEQARDVRIDGPGGPLELRAIAPREDPARGAFLHIHGGGWTLGECDMQDLRLQRVADETGLAVVSVGYRLAPENPYPAAVEDCEAAALWLLEHPTELELPSGAPRVIGGDSAGGHLAACTLLRLRDRHGVRDAFAAAVLQYGAFDLSLTPSQRQWGERELVLSTPLIRWFGDQFLPGHELEQRRDPAISPLYADLAGLPPAIFTIGTADPLLDDSLFMHARWLAAGNRAELCVWPEAPHGFLALPYAVADLALSAEHEFVRRTLGFDAA